MGNPLDDLVAVLNTPTPAPAPMQSNPLDDLEQIGSLDSKNAFAAVRAREDAFNQPWDTADDSSDPNVRRQLAYESYLTSAKDIGESHGSNPELAQQYMQQYQHWRSLKKAHDAGASAGTSPDMAASIVSSMTPEEQQVYLDSLKETWKKRGKIGFRESIDRLGARGGHLPIIGSIVSADQWYEARKAAEALQAERDGGPAMDDATRKKAMNKLWKVNMQALEYEARSGQSFIGQVGEGIAQLPAFMLEFMGSAGIANAAGGAATTALGRTLGIGFRAAEGGQAFIPRGVAGLLPRAAGWTAAGATRASTSLLPRVFEGAEERRFYGEDATKAYAKAFADQTIEAMSETSGETLAAVVGKVIEKTPGLKKLYGVWQKATKGKKVDFINKVLHHSSEAARMTGFHGTLEEMGEERVGDALRALTGVQDFDLKGDQNTLKNRLAQAIFPGFERLAVEAAQFAVPGIVDAGGGLLGGRSKPLPEDVAKFFRGNPEAVKDLIAAGKSSRTAFEEVAKKHGLEVPKLNAEERAKVVEELKNPAAPPTEQAQEKASAAETVSGAPLSEDAPASDLMASVDEQHERRRKPGLPRDESISGLPYDQNGGEMESIFNRAAEAHSQAGRKVTFGDGDIGNVGGMNAYLGHQGTDEVLRNVFRILKEEVGEDRKALITRRKGDELTIVGFDKDAAGMQEALDRASKRVQEYAENTKVKTIEVKDKETGEVKVPAGTEMRLADIPAGKKGGVQGVGLYGIFEDYKGGDVKDHIASLSSSVEAKKAEVAYGRRQAGTAGPVASSGEAGRAARGVAAPREAEEGKPRSVAQGVAGAGSEAAEGQRQVDLDAKKLAELTKTSPGEANNQYQKIVKERNLKKWEADALRTKVRELLGDEETKKATIAFKKGEKVKATIGLKKVEGTVAADAAAGEPVQVQTPKGVKKVKSERLKKVEEAPSERREEPTQPPAVVESPGAPGGAESGEAGAAPQQPAPEVVPGRRGKQGLRRRGQDSGVESQPDGGGGDGAGSAGPDSAGGEGLRRSEPAEAEPRVEAAAEGVQEEDRSRNHVIQPEHELAPRGEVGKLRANLDAINILKTLDTEKRSATDEEKVKLAQYTGWGGLSQTLDEGKGQAMLDREAGEPKWRWEYRQDEAWEKKWGKYYKELKSALSEEEFKRALASTRNAHYTSREIISSMWDMAKRLGFRGGNVLEPAAGVGHFFGLMPKEFAGSKLVGVELDSITGKILGALYPKAQTFNKGLEEVDLPPNSIDLAISNVPFDEIGPRDAEKRYDQKLNLHNYFLARMLDAVRPGGMVVAISTHRTMDSQAKQREFLATKGELIGAIRLPNDAFKGNANTEVTTDILFIRKPDGVPSPFRQSWTGISEVKAVEGVPARVNEYFVDHPEMMLGDPSMAGKMRGNPDELKEFTLKPNGKDLGGQLMEAMKRLPENIMGGNKADAFDFSKLGEATGHRDGELVEREGRLVVAENGKFIDATKIEKRLDNPKMQQRAREYMGLRDHYQQHIDLMLSPDSTDAQIDESRKKLNKLYDQYIKKHGNLNARGTAGLFEFDPGVYLVQSLENEVKKKGEPSTFVKADVFEKRTIPARREPTSATSIEDALRVSLGFRGNLNVAYIARLLDQSEEDVKSALTSKALAYENPGSGLWETKEQYLSGNVRQKLRDAEAAAEKDERFARNVKALEKAQPKAVAAKEIAFRLGGTWIPQDIVEKFARDIFGSHMGSIRYIPEVDRWTVTGFQRTTKVTETFGTARMRGDELLSSALNLKTPQIYDTVENGDSKSRVFNQKETVAAQAAVERLHKEFQSWVRGKDALMDRLQEEYNKKFNFYVEPNWDGSHMELPGSSASIKLRPYQKSVLWRFLQQGYGVLAHAVGAGKTYTMISTAMELRRTGLARKPLIVVQNSTLGQFATSARKFYPGAKILVASKEDLSSGSRQRFMTRVASGDYDMIVMAQSSFDLLPNDPQREVDFVQGQIDELEEAIREMREREGKKDPTVKELEKAKRALEERLKTTQDRIKERQDNAITFERMGVDALFLDEAHAYKKPPFVTKLGRISGLNRTASQRSFNVLMKLRFIQDRNNGRGVYLATGTPVTNTMGEAWHMLNLAAPQALREFNVTTFDRFVSTFAEVLPTLEMNAGGKWVQRDTLAKFTNGPEFIKLIRSTWDVVTTDDLHTLLADLNLGLPKLKGGKVSPVVVPLSRSVASFNKFLRDVYDKYQKLPGDEKKELSYIPVLTYNAARAAALDIQLVYPNAKEDAGSKINTAVERAFEIYQNTDSSKGTQLIFADQFNHVNMSKLAAFAAGEEVGGIDIDEKDEGDQDETGSDQFLYKKLVSKLVAKGIPAAEIAVMSDYNTDAKREALFERVNRGEVRVLIGSTAKMGVGVNVQKKLAALHHLDTPWLPADLEQREGRIMRYGNENEEVEINAYGMEKTLDAAIYSKILRKAKFIRQVMSGRINGREFDDPAGALVLTAQEQQALLAGDPRILQKVELENNLRILRVEREAFEDSLQRQRDRKKQEQTYLDLQEKQLPAIEKMSQATELDPKDAAGYTDTSGKQVKTRGRKELADAVQADLDANLERQWKELLEEGIQGKRVLSKGQVGPVSFQVEMTAQPVVKKDDKGGLKSAFERTIKTSIMVDGKSVYSGGAQTGAGVADAVFQTAQRLNEDAQRTRLNIEAKRKSIEELTRLLGQSWPKEAEYQESEKRLADIEADLTKVEDEKPKDGVREISKEEWQDKINDAEGRKYSLKPGQPANVSREDFERTFPGTKISELGDGWRITFENGYYVDAKVVDKINIDWDEAERTYGRKFSAKERASIGAAGSFEIRTKDGITLDGIGIMQLARGIADSATIKHESVHMAKRLGLFLHDEWEALVKEHSSPSRSEEQQEEDIAQARELWEPGKGFVNKMKRWARGLLESLGFTKGLDAEAVHKLMDTAEFWRRVPEIDSNGKKTIDLYFGRPDLANPARSQEVRDLVDKVDQQRKEAGEPGRRADSAVQREAKELLEKHYVKTRNSLLKAGREGGQLNDVETIAAKEIINKEGLKALKSGDATKLADAVALIDAYRRTGTEQARGFRQRRDPVETPAQRRQRMIMEGILTPPKAYKLKGEELHTAWAKKLPELLYHLKKLGVDVNDLEKTGENPVQASRALGTIQAAKADTWDAMYEYWRNSILSAPTTHLANVAGNLGHTAWHFTAERMTEAMLNTLVRRPSGAQLGEFTHILAGVLPGLAQGARNFVHSFKSETPYFETELGLDGSSKLEEPDVAIEGAKGRLIRIPQRLLMAADEFSKSLIARMDVAAQAYRIAKDEGLSSSALQVRMEELTTDPESLAWERAMETTKELTFQDDGGKLTRAAINIRNAVPGFRYLMPFITTPMNILRIGIRKSPMGSLGLARRVYEGATTGNWKGITKYTAEQMIAWGLLLALMQNDDDDPWITGASVERESRGKRDLAYRTTPPQSIKIGDKWYSYNRLEPFASTLSLIVDMLQSLRYGDNNEKLWAPIQSLLGQVKSKSFLSGMGDILDVIEGPEGAPDKLARWASSFAVSWIPNTIRSGGRSAQDEIKERGVWGDGPEWVSRMLRRTIQKTELPIVDDVPAYDLWGRTKPRTHSPVPGTDWLYRILVPINIKEGAPFVGDQILTNWNNEHPEDEKAPLPPTKRYKVGLKEYSMTDEQYGEYSKLAGELTAKVVEGLKWDVSKPTATDIDVLTDIISDARKAARTYLAKKWHGKAGDFDVAKTVSALRQGLITKKGDEASSKRSEHLSAKDKEEGLSLKDKRAAEDMKAAEAARWLLERGGDPKELRQEYWKYLLKAYKTEGTRAEHMQRFNARLRKAQ